MPISKSNLSLATSRVPFGRVTELMQVPIALFEILSLAREIKGEKAKQIERLADDIIKVTLADEEALVKLSNAAGNGYEMRFSRTENTE